MESVYIYIGMGRVFFHRFWKPHTGSKCGVMVFRESMLDTEPARRRQLKRDGVVHIGHKYDYDGHGRYWNTSSNEEVRAAVLYSRVLTPLRHTIHP